MYKNNRNDILGLKISDVTLVALMIAIVVVFFKIIKIPQGLITGIGSTVGGFFDKSEQVQATRDRNLKDAETRINNAGRSYGDATAEDVTKSNELYTALSSAFGNDKKVIEIFSTITGPAQMNRIYNHFGIKKIRYGFLWYDSVEGDLIAHITASKIDVNKVHKGPVNDFTIQFMLNLIGK